MNNGGNSRGKEKRMKMEPGPRLPFSAFQVAGSGTVYRPRKTNRCPKQEVADRSLVPSRCYGHHGRVRRGLKTHRKILSTTSGAFKAFGRQHL